MIENETETETERQSQLRAYNAIRDTRAEGGNSSINQKKPLAIVAVAVVAPCNR